MAEITTSTIFYIADEYENGAVFSDLGYFTSEEDGEAAIAEYAEKLVEEAREQNRRAHGGLMAAHRRAKEQHDKSVERGLLLGPFLDRAPADPEDSAQYESIRHSVLSGYAVYPLEPHGSR